MRHALSLRRPLLPGLAMSGALMLGALLLGCAGPAAAQTDGLVSQPSRHSVADTLQRLRAAVQGVEWVVLGEIDHAAAARAAGLELRARTVLLVGNPKAGTGAMRARPTLAIDLPMRLLVWQDDQGAVMVTRSTGTDIAERVFARHGIAIDATGRAGTERLLDGLVQKATQ